jgi:hypothetical protein
MDGADVLEVWKDGGQVRVDLGEGATERVILGDSFLTYFNNFITLYLAHTHSSAVGPTGPPQAPVDPMTDVLLSDLAKTRKT